MRKIKPIAPDAFCFDGEFGSAGTALVPLEAENSFCVRLGLAPTGGGGRWTNRFQCVIKTGARGNSLHLELHRPSESLAWFNEYIVSYSYDRRNWHPVPYRSGERGLTVDYLDFPEFEEDRVYIGGQIPYTAEILEEQIAQWTRQSSVVVHVIGQSMEGRPLYRLTVGTETPGGPAHYVANHHPGEGMACWRIVGMIEWLIGPHGEEARREQCFHFMPLSCPDGPAHGWSRCNAAGIDMNRSYRAEGSRAEEQALEVFSCQRDIEGLMCSPQPLTSAWLMHTWGGLVEPLILPGKGLIGSGGWEAFAAALAENDRAGQFRPLALYGDEEKVRRSAHFFNNGLWLQFGMTVGLVEGGGALHTQDENKMAGQTLIRTVARFFAGEKRRVDHRRSGKRSADSEDAPEL